MNDCPPTFETIAARCKFCKCSVTIKIDSTGARIFNVSLWLKDAACNRCGDFFRKIGDLTEQLEAIAEISRWPMNADQKQRIRGSIIGVTKKYAKLACKHYEVIDSWEPEIVDQILDNPDKVIVIMRAFRRMIAKKETANLPMI